MTRNKVAALGVVTRERPTRTTKPVRRHCTRGGDRTAGRAPFPRIDFRRYYLWPAGLMVVLDLTWTPQERRAA